MESLFDFQEGQWVYHVLKMVKNRFNKVGFIISEALIIPFALVIVGFTIFMASSASVADENTFEGLAPQIGYEYPKSVVYIFLNFPISVNDSMGIFGDDKIYTVSDLFWVNSDDSKKLISDYRDIYLDFEDLDFDKSLDLFNRFSKKELKEKDLLMFKFDSKATDLKTEISKGNFYLRVPTYDGAESLVYFSAPAKRCKLSKDC